MRWIQADHWYNVHAVHGMRDSWRCGGPQHSRFITPTFINLAPREIGEEPKAKNQNVGFSHCPLHPGTAAGPAGSGRSSQGSVPFPRWAPQPVPAYGGGQSWLPSSQHKVPRPAGRPPPHLQFLSPRIPEPVHNIMLITISIPPFSSRCAAWCYNSKKENRKKFQNLFSKDIQIS